MILTGLLQIAALTTLLQIVVCDFRYFLPIKMTFNTCEGRVY